MNKKALVLRIKDNSMDEVWKEYKTCKGLTFSSKEEENEFKITNHKDGSRSFRFGKKELVNGSEERKKALMSQASVTGGTSSTLADLIKADRDEIVKYTTSLGSEALTILWELCLTSEKFPFGQGCKEIAKKALNRRGRYAKKS